MSLEVVDSCIILLNSISESRAWSVCSWAQELIHTYRFDPSRWVTWISLLNRKWSMWTQKLRDHNLVEHTFLRLMYPSSTYNIVCPRETLAIWTEYYTDLLTRWRCVSFFFTIFLCPGPAQWNAEWREWSKPISHLKGVPKFDCANLKSPSCIRILQCVSYLS